MRIERFEEYLIPLNEEMIVAARDGKTPMFQSAWQLLTMTAAQVENLMTKGTLASAMERQRFARDYGFSLPCSELRASLARPILDPMAGSGWLAELLRRSGLDVVASDLDPWEPSYGVVEVLGASMAVRRHHDRLVLLSWPPLNYDGACLDAMALGQQLCLISEGKGGCVGSEEMFDRLADSFEPGEDVVIPQWFGINDYASFWTKR